MCEAYGDVVNDVALVGADSGASGRVQDDDRWNLGDILRSRNTDVCASLVDFTSVAVPDKSDNVWDWH